MGALLVGRCVREVSGDTLRKFPKKMVRSVLFSSGGITTATISIDLHENCTGGYHSVDISTFHMIFCCPWNQ
jgi:hypothetical protein